MIVDNICRLGVYNLPQGIVDNILAFIEKAKNENLEVGRYDLDGDNLFAMVQVYVGKEHCEGKWETHEQYVDLQYILNGTEIIKCADCNKLTLVDNYNESLDIAFYEDYKEDSLSILESDMFGLYFPHDAHMPGLKVNDEEVNKIVFKIKVNKLS